MPKKILDGLTSVQRYRLRHPERSKESCRKYYAAHKHELKPRHPNWAIWRSMKQRCTDPNRKDYQYYGGRGITFTEKWETLAGFNEDMGARPTLLHTLERKNGNLGYSKENCVWATRLEQSQNTRMTKLVEINGQTKSISEWCRVYGISRTTVAGRMHKCGWSAVESITTPKSCPRIACGA